MRIRSTLPLAHGKFHILCQWYSNINVTKNNLDRLIIFLALNLSIRQFIWFSSAPFFIGLSSILSTFIQLEPLTVLSSRDQALGKFCQFNRIRCYSNFENLSFHILVFFWYTFSFGLLAFWRPWSIWRKLIPIKDSNKSNCINDDDPIKYEMFQRSNS